VVDEPVVDVEPLVMREDPHEIALDPVGILLPGQSEAVCEAEHVGVDRDALHLAERVADHDVGGLAGDSGQADEALHRVGHLPAVLGDDHAGSAHDRLRLVAEEACGPDDLLHLVRVRSGQVLRFREALEEDGRHLVHAHVGGLSREDDRDEQVVRRVVVQHDVRVGVEPSQPVHDDARPLSPLHSPSRAVSCRSSRNEMVHEAGVLDPVFPRGYPR
jgi:hypothetical protein